VSHLEASLARLAARERERDPFTELGFTLAFSFSPPSPDVPAAIASRSALPISSLFRSSFTRAPFPDVPLARLHAF